MISTPKLELPVVAAFDSGIDIQVIVQRLIDVGVLREEISLVAGDGESTNTNALVDERVRTEANPVRLSGLLTGWSAMAIPGFGPLVLAGPLAATLVGAPDGGLARVLEDAGVAVGDAQFYSEHLRRGGILLTIHGKNAQSQEVHDILRLDGAVIVGEHEQESRQGGGNGFDSDAGPYASAQSQQELDKNIDFLSTRAIEVLGTRDKALRWLTKPIRSLDNKTPIALLHTPDGVQRVEDVLGRIEQGIW